MVVGVLRVVLLLDGARSLKEKRHIVKSIIGRIKSRYNASVAEVGLNDKWKNAVIGVACVSNEVSHANSMLTSIINYIENDGRLVIMDYSTESIFVE